MTQILITSDVHGRLDRLGRVIAEGQAQGASALLDLGDVGTNACYSLLRSEDARACFGNYEVSGWLRLSAENQAWVRSLPPTLDGPGYLAAHATPALPRAVRDVEQMMDHMLERELRGQDVFRRLDRDEDARWLAYAELLERGKAVLFHGHTHRQVVWRIGPDQSMSRLNAQAFALEAGAHYLVGVGSVGQPEDGLRPGFALCDTAGREVQLLRL